MPNWCHNTLNVSGDEAEVTRFVEAVKESDEQPLSFEKLAPTPSPEEIAAAQSGHPLFGNDWYGWRIGNWGTKWDASFSSGAVTAIGPPGSEMDVEATKSSQGATLTPTVAVYKFDTAWSPPVPFVELASEKFGELEFVLRFGEVGHEVAGEMKYVAGVCVEDTELEITEVLAPEEMWF